MSEIDLARTRILSYLPRDAQEKTVQVLTALLDHAPTPAGCKNVASDINSAPSDNALYELSQQYIRTLLIPMRAARRETPLRSLHPSRLPKDWNVDGEDLKSQVEEATRDKHTLKVLALRRDGYRCLITGEFDISSAKANLVEVLETACYSFTDPAHIIPFSIAPKDEASKGVDKAANIFHALSRFSGYECLNVRDLSGLSNVLTLRNDIHALFRELYFWFEEIEGEPNAYHCRSKRNLCGVHNGEKIVFTSSHSDLDPPDVRLLRLHASIAKVLHTSGIDVVIDKWIRDYEEVRVLSQDGSLESFTLLETALALWVEPEKVRR